mmetsp:Transcript_9377/g.36591  ORF Transcript_9377/g.36591 Transcript_9377/m.36591 type:complete len:520 (+) Transcript_9377:105-1664(+)
MWRDAGLRRSALRRSVQRRSALHGPAQRCTAQRCEAFAPHSARVGPRLPLLLHRPPRAGTGLAMVPHRLRAPGLHETAGANARNVEVRCGQQVSRGVSRGTDALAAGQRAAEHGPVAPRAACARPLHRAAETVPSIGPWPSPLAPARAAALSCILCRCRLRAALNGAKRPHRHDEHAAVGLDADVLRVPRAKEGGCELHHGVAALLEGDEPCQLLGVRSAEPRHGLHAGQLQGRGGHLDGPAPGALALGGAEARGRAGPAGGGEAERRAVAAAAAACAANAVCAAGAATIGAGSAGAVGAGASGGAAGGQRAGRRCAGRRCAGRRGERGSRSRRAGPGAALSHGSVEAVQSGARGGGERVAGGGGSSGCCCSGFGFATRAARSRGRRIAGANRCGGRADVHGKGIGVSLVRFATGVDGQRVGVRAFGTTPERLHRRRFAVPVQLQLWNWGVGLGCPLCFGRLRVVWPGTLGRAACSRPGAHGRLPLDGSDRTARRASAGIQDGIVVILPGARCWRVGPL